VVILAATAIVAACGDDDAADSEARSDQSGLTVATTDAADTTTAGQAAPAPAVDTTAPDSGETDSTEAPPAATDPATTAADADASSGEVPDPCSLVSADQLAGVLGSPPGAGSMQTVSPDQRKVCMYDTGLILAVEVGENYEAVVELMRDVAAVQDVAGVGEAAAWQDVGGGIGQFVALGDEYYVGVTLAGGQAEGQAIAEAMLAAL
jgi:hypothetical protein